MRFEVEHLPLAARLYLAARTRGASPRRQDRLAAIALMRLFRLAARSGGGTGRLAFDARGRRVSAPFTGSNLQFRALYMPVYRHGYEAVTAAVLTSFLPADGVFYDIGSNWGFFSFCVAANPDFSGKVVAFEPNPVARRDLEQIRAASGLSDLIAPQAFGLGSRTERLGMSADSRTQTGRTRLVAPGRGDTVVEVRRLDDLELPPPDVIKIDVEGMEIDILEGGRRLIAEYKPFIVFESWSDPTDPFSSAPIFRVLGEMRYEIFTPAFAFEHDGAFALVQHDEAHAALRDRGLTPHLELAPVDLRTRPIMHTHLNFFACHRDRIEATAKLMDPR